ncbi:MAG TPA: YhcN/YlaJ family sporulation lipoprotein, partial [Chondromyces sp.]|nr:YhcN/YlaJ family sporulation lipoprotein [Chondromyces sp.]
RTASDGKLAVRIADAARSVKNVHDVRSVAYGSDVLIAVNLEDYSQEEKTKERIKDAVKPYLNGRSCTVVTDEGTFIRLRNLDHDFHDDGPYEKIGDTDLRDIFGTIREQTGR